MDNESVKDYQVALKLYFENRKQFMFTFFFFIFGIISLVITTITLIFLFRNSGNLSAILIILVLISFFSIFFILLSYIRSTFGLAYDIMSSGDLFTEFKKSIKYFKKNWLVFLLLSAPIGLIIFLEQILSTIIIFYYLFSEVDYRPYIIPIKVFVYIIDFSYFVLFIGIFPSIVAKQKVRAAFKENSKILRLHLKRIMLSIGIYYLIFRGLMFLIDALRIIFTSNLSTFNIFNFLFFFTAMLNIAVGMPIYSLISTRIYNLTDSKDFDDL